MSRILFVVGAALWAVAASAAHADAAEKARLVADAEAGKDKAVVGLGLDYEEGTDEDPTRKIMAAYDLYGRTVATSNFARTRMCIALLTGDPVPRDEARGLDLCQHADFGYGGGERALIDAYRLEHGIGRAADPAKAYKSYTYLATVFPPAATVMGDHAYAQGDLVQARTWYTGNADFSLRSLVRLAQMVEAGEGGPRDVQEAAWLYSVAAQEGSPDAAEWLKGRAETAALPHIKPDLDGHDLAVKMNFVWKGQPGRDVYVAQTLELFIPPKGHDEFDIVHMEVTCYVTAGHRIDICLTTGPDIGGAYSRALRDAYSGDIVVPDSDRDGQATASTLYSRPICYGFHCG